MDNLCRNATFCQFFGCEQQLIGHNSRAKQRNIRAFAQYVRATDFELRLARYKQRRFFSWQSYIVWSLVSRHRKRHLLRLACITRCEYDHIWQTAHQRDILEHLVCCAVCTNVEPGVRTNDFNRAIIQANRRPDLLPISPRTKRRIARRKRHCAHRRQTARHRHEILLSHANFDAARFAKFFLKFTKTHTLHQVAAQRNHLRMFSRRQH